MWHGTKLPQLRYWIINLWLTIFVTVFQFLQMLLVEPTLLVLNTACNLLDHMCVQLIESLIQFADSAIPKRGGKRLAGWDEEVKPIREKSLLWSKIWHEAGCPSNGVLFQLKKHAKARYKYAVRRLRRKQDQLRSRKMAEAFVGDNSRDF